MHRACLVLGPCLSLEQEEKKDSQSNGQNGQSCIDLLNQIHVPGTYLNA